MQRLNLGNQKMVSEADCTKTFKIIPISFSKESKERFRNNLNCLKNSVQELQILAGCSGWSQTERSVWCGYHQQRLRCHLFVRGRSQLR